MKLLTLKKFAVAAAFGALTLAPWVAAQAQEAAAANTAGTVQEFIPGNSQITILSAGSPVTYSYSRKTAFLDAAGNVVDPATIKTGESTTVYYSTMAGQLLVNKIVLQRAPATVTKTETATTTTTISGKR